MGQGKLVSRGGFNKAAKLDFIVAEVIYRNIRSRWNIDSLPAVSQPVDAVGAAMRITAGGVALKGAAEQQIVFFFVALVEFVRGAEGF